jgi:hypothetical protein
VSKRLIRVLVVPVGQEPEVRSLPSESFGAAVKELVGGDFEAHPLDEGEDGGRIDALVNEMGMADGLPRNCWVPSQFLHGPIVVFRTDAKGKSVDLTELDIQMYSGLLGLWYQQGIAEASTGRRQHGRA